MMLSLYEQEAAFDAGKVMSAANACSLSGFDLDIEYDDLIGIDLDEVTGEEEAAFLV